MYRIRLFFGFLALFFIAVWLRLGYWQTVMYDELSAVAFAQYTSKSVMPAVRGEIWTADAYPLVVNKPYFRVTADPTQVDSAEISAIAALLSDSYSQYVAAKSVRAEEVWREASASARLPEKPEATVSAELLAVSPSPMPSPSATAFPKPEFDAKELRNEILALLRETDRRWVLLLDPIPQDVKQKIEEKQFKGIYFEQTDLRGYPDDRYASYVTGFLHSSNDGSMVGSYGIEEYYEQVLRGAEGRKWFEKTLKGYPIPVSDSQEIDSLHGYQLNLSLNRALQATITRMLSEGVQKYGALRGDVVVMDPVTGQVIAMVSYPSFSPEYWQYADAERYTNPAVANAYEPGSTFKVLVMAAGIDAGVVTPDTHCPVCAGPRKIGPYFIRTWNNQYQDNPTMTDVLVHSDNTGMVYVGEKLGSDRLYNYVQKFGFGQKSGIDVQEDAGSPLRGQKEMREIDYATMTFGQGIAVTPMQMVRAVAVIANGGTLPTPRLVESLERDDELTKLTRPESPRVISEQAARTATEMMKASASFGEAKFAYLKGYSIAGKTGTAQVAIEGNYDEKKTIASFIGFAPADDPKYVMLVKLDEPTSSQWGSETAAPLWFAISKEIMRYYGIMPEK